MIVKVGQYYRDSWDGEVILILSSNRFRVVEQGTSIIGKVGLIYSAAQWYIEQFPENRWHKIPKLKARLLYET